MKGGKELNKTFQDPKLEIETMKKSQRETTLEIENLEQRSGVIDKNHQQNTRDKKRESQVQKIPQKTLTQLSKKIQNAKSS